MRSRILPLVPLAASIWPAAAAARTPANPWRGGDVLTIAHQGGDAGGPRRRRHAWTRLIGWCVDGVMTARPRAFERIAMATDRAAACDSPT